MKHEDFKIIKPENGFPGLDNGPDTKEEDKIAGEILTSGINPVSKADRIRERVFRNRIRNSNKKYLKPYLRG